MKVLFKLMVLGIVLSLTTIAQAQILRNNPRLQERLKQAKLREIQKTLMLDDEKMRALSPIYTRYDSEINNIHFARLGKPQGTNLKDLSADDADKLIIQQLDNAVKISTVRKNYYPEFKTVLTPQQVMALFRAEAQIRRRIMQEMRRRVENKTE